MDDRIPKLNGKNNIIKAALPATYDQFRQQAAAGLYADVLANNLPPSDPNAGADVIGTPLNKANLLSDETASMYGLSEGERNVDAALGKATFKNSWRLEEFFSAVNQNAISCAFGKGDAKAWGVGKALADYAVIASSIVPKLTSNSQAGYTVTGTGTFATNPYRVFDGDLSLNNALYNGTGAASAVVLTFPQSERISGFQIWGCHGNGQTTTFTIDGSVDGANFVNLSVVQMSGSALYWSPIMELYSEQTFQKIRITDNDKYAYFGEMIIYNEYKDSHTFFPSLVKKQTFIDALNDPLSLAEIKGNSKLIALITANPWANARYSKY